MKSHIAAHVGVRHVECNETSRPNGYCHAEILRYAQDDGAPAVTADARRRAAKTAKRANVRAPTSIRKDD